MSQAVNDHCILNRLNNTQVPHLANLLVTNILLETIGLVLVTAFFIYIKLECSLNKSIHEAMKGVNLIKCL